MTATLTETPTETLNDRLAASVAATHSTTMPRGAFDDWWHERWRAGSFQVDRIPFAGLDGWSFAPDTGNLVHRSGRFFTVEGLDVDDGTRTWNQPIIDQPEVGILGILVKEFDGVLHALMQAKMEPGNSNLLQLSPTVQATRSNYSRVHQGTSVNYLEYFAGTGRARVLADALQSEHGSWFLHKRNRNMVVETTDDVPEHEDFRWLTLGQIGELLRRDNLVNMDARSALSLLPLHRTAPPTDEFGTALADSMTGAGSVHGIRDILTWINDLRALSDLRTTRVPLRRLGSWRRTAERIHQEDERFFDVIAVAVRAGNREVTGWTQPLFAPRGPGVVAFVVRRIAGVLHVLAAARTEAGFRDTVELGPTVQCVPGNHPGTPPPFLDYVLSARPDQIRYDAILSEEGGRFYHSDSRYLVVEAGEEAEEQDGFRWTTLHQFTELLSHTHYVSVQARSLLACLGLACPAPSFTP
ncbi:NDP-hexose 2,3-dehydratase family protein [Actinoallomurus sp. CA-150999]|uniref:NDP-hexose 2,3-dehydratase family protein n=1 Tax=Actinoallomurus sp. CA-150999 TaxID=3239887 RepID=UPI003D9500A5